ncbi:MAG: SGNH/GDSL hydrolase family protein [Deltaproteobacteria bacterium]|nr:SGNH/GDSL hydrolase family protein [Deltaproteobacteria bacterium]
MLPLEITAGNATLGVSANPRLGWSPKPGSADVNVDGYRDRVFPTAKPAGTFRIEVLGDPVTFGARVTSRDDTFAKVMERGLDRLLGGVEVLNLGVPGYDTVQEVEPLRERGLRYSPDLVLLGVCLNDFEPVSGAGPLAVLAEANTARGRLLAAVRRRLLLSSDLFRLVYARVTALAKAGPGLGTTARCHDRRGRWPGARSRRASWAAELSKRRGFSVAVPPPAPPPPPHCRRCFRGSTGGPGHPLEGDDSSCRSSVE